MAEVEVPAWVKRLPPDLQKTWVEGTAEDRYIVRALYQAMRLMPYARSNEEVLAAMKRPRKRR